MDAVVTAQALAKFSWPTHAVIDLLKLNPQELGLVARIGRREPSSSEWVAPGVLRLPDASSPTSVYQFVFSVGPRAKLTCKIFGRNRGQPVEKQEFPDIPGGGLLVFNWKPEDREKGEYRLVVGGEAKVTGARIYQEVIFLHDPAFEMGKE
jgi:hypothetical protein